MTANTTVTPSALTTPIPLTTIYQMTEDELKTLLRVVKDRLKLAHMLSADNLNVVSVRLSLDSCDTIRRIAAARQSTLSDVARDAIDAYCKKETKR